MKKEKNKEFNWLAEIAGVGIVLVVVAAFILILWSLISMIGGVIDRFAENGRYNDIYNGCLEDAAFRYCEEQGCGVIGVTFGDIVSAPQFSARFDERRGDSSIIQFTYQERIDCMNRAEASRVNG